MTEDQVREAKSLRATGMGWKRIGQYLGGISYYVIRGTLEPDWKKIRNITKREFMKLKRMGRVTIQLPNRVHDENITRIWVPPEVLAEKELAYADAPSLGQSILGDPPFLRSALGRKLQNVDN